MSREKPANPRPKRVSRRATDATDSDGLRIRLRLSPADAAALEALRGEEEDDADAIRRLIRTAALHADLLDGLAEIKERLDGLTLAPASTSAGPGDGEEAEAQEPDRVTRQKATIAGQFLDDDEDDEDDEAEDDAKE